MRIVFWQPLISQHYASIFKSLSSMPGIEVNLVVQEEMTETRRQQGWQIPDIGSTKTFVEPDSSEISRLINQDPENSYHLFQDFRNYPVNREGFEQCVKTNLPMALMLENRQTAGVKGIARMLRYAKVHWKYENRIKATLIMGYGGNHGGKVFYSRCGFPTEKMFPFAYFTAANDNVIPEKSSDGVVKLACLGQCIHRKGGDILIQALQPLKDLNWILYMAGNGPKRAEWESLAANLGLSDRIQFMDTLPYQKALSLIASADLYLLPSRFDGWGASVNEALMSGVPVICSDRCGALDLLQEKWRGDCFTAGDPVSLSTLLRDWIARGKKTPELSERIKNWAECIGGESAANYLIDILTSSEAGPKPVAPWFKQQPAVPNDSSAEAFASMG